MSENTIVVLFFYGMSFIVAFLIYWIEKKRLKSKFEKEFQRVNIMRCIYQNIGREEELLCQKRFASYPTIKGYVSMVDQIEKALDYGMEIEDLPIRIIDAKNKTSRERKRIENLIREVKTSRLKDQEVFEFVNGTASIMQMIYQFQHPIKSFLWEAKSNVVFFTLKVRAKIFKRVNMLDKKTHREYARKIEKVSNSHNISYAYAN